MGTAARRDTARRLTLLVLSTLLPGAMPMPLLAQTTTATATDGSSPRSLEPSLELPGTVWSMKRDGFELQLTQMPRDTVRAFFQGRGFSAQHSTWIADACVLQTIMRNTAAPEPKVAIDIDLRRWRVIDDSGSHPPKLQAHWRDVLQQAGASHASQIALQWSLFPSHQSFYPGDYNWGMLSLGPAPGSHFDLALEWSLAGKQYTHTINDMQCPSE